MEKPVVKQENWYIICAIKTKTRCRFRRHISGCNNPLNIARPKKCSYENCPVAVGRMCRRAGNCMFHEKVEFDNITKMF